jgi:hypothetical protein
MKLNVDKIYCLHCIEDINRYNYIIKTITNFGGQGMLSQTYISKFTKLKINTHIGNNITEIHTDYYNLIKKQNPDVYGNVFSCMYNWLQLISHAYYLGYNSILCIEDDIGFNENIESFNDYLDNKPENADIILFGCKIFRAPNIFDELKSNNLYIKVDNSYKISGMYGVWMNKRGMEYYLKYIQEKICCADLLFNNIDNEIQRQLNINIYLPNKEFISHKYVFNSIITKKNKGEP